MRGKGYCNGMRRMARRFSSDETVECVRAAKHQQVRGEGRGTSGEERRLCTTSKAWQQGRDLSPLPVAAMRRSYNDDDVLQRLHEKPVGAALSRDWMKPERQRHSCPASKAWQQGQDLLPLPVAAGAPLLQEWRQASTLARKKCRSGAQPRWNETGTAKHSCPASKAWQQDRNLSHSLVAAGRRSYSNGNTLHRSRKTCRSGAPAAIKQPNT